MNSRLFIPIIKGGIEVSDSKPSATIIDISPFVMNISSSSTPEFVIRTAAVAFPVPSSEVTEEMEHRGFTFGLVGKEWWQSESGNATANLRLAGADLSPDSLKVSVKNGGQGTTIRLVIVSPLVQMAGAESEDRMPSILGGAAVFVVQSNGTLVPLRQFVGSATVNRSLSSEEIGGAFFGTGYNLSAGASATFSFTGQISLGFSFDGLTNRSVVPGEQYVVTVIGTDALASTVVVAA